MAHLIAEMDPDLVGAHADTASALLPLLPALRDGDAVLVKGSLAMGMKTVVDALRKDAP
jgi:UDP-N-acetylmuramoyl-tripeptide--D-alanyl-D-alanine ligase